MRYFILSLIFLLGCGNHSSQNAVGMGKLIILRQDQGVYKQVQYNKKIFYNDIFWLKTNKSSIYSHKDLVQSKAQVIFGEGQCGTSNESRSQQVVRPAKRKFLEIRKLLPKISLDSADALLCDFYVTVAHETGSSETYVLKEAQVDVTSQKEKLKRKLLQKKNEGFHFRKFD